MTYAEKFKDPRWQKKRLEILKQHGFECTNCGGKDEELNVHHKFYKKDTAPWEYEDDELTVFCKTCHESWHAAKKEAEQVIGNFCTAEDIYQLIGYALAISGDVFPRELHSYHHVIGYADAFRTNIKVVEYLVREAKKAKGIPLSPSFELTKQMGK